MPGRAPGVLGRTGPLLLSVLGRHRAIGPEWSPNSVRRTDGMGFSPDIKRRSGGATPFTWQDTQRSKQCPGSLL